MNVYMLTYFCRSLFKATVFLNTLFQKPTPFLKVNENTKMVLIDLKC
jgi:hypothetical protein